MTSEQAYMLNQTMENVMSFSCLSAMLGVVGYVFSALALYTIAQRREIKCPWLAWIPVLNVWVLGSISDQYRYMVRGEVKSKRKFLLLLSILHGVLNLVAAFFIIRGLVDAVALMFKGAGGYVPTFSLLHGIQDALLWMLAGLIVKAVVLVMGYMALYDLFASCEPANNVLYLILSIIPGINQITKPLFLFLCRDLDEGMPSRRETVENL